MSLLMKRRRFLKLAGIGAVVVVGGVAGLRFGLPRLLRPRPPGELDEEAVAFVERCFAGLDRGRLWDSHVHLLGLGGGGTGCWVNPDSRSHLHPIRRFQFDLFRSAVGIGEDATADRDYLERLLELHRLANPQGKLLCMAFDVFVDESGVERPELSAFHTPNEYVLDLAARHEELHACVSIHPYRADAVDRLDAAAARGARAVKWLPNSMGIDPDSPRCDPFYRRLAELGLPLITHGGREYAVDLRHDQELGNPLKLRRGLDHGARLIVAHCASFGSLNDLDEPEGERRQLQAFDLFMRLFTDRQYEKTLHADISGLTLINRSARVLRELLTAEELHPRLVNGSDYPIPALSFVFSPLKLEFEGFLTRAERELCRRVARANPLLFDFVLKRTVSAESGGRRYRLANAVFETERLFQGGAQLVGRSG